jgi:hypothetical protein
MKITTRFLSGLALATACLASRPAQAHFLWAEIGSGAQPQLRVTIAEASGENTTGELLERIGPASAWDGSGKALALAPATDAMAAPGPSNVVGAFQNWGVLDKTAEGRGVFLLEYYAKAARSIDDASQHAKLPVEVFVRREAPGSSTCIATLKHNGQPVAKAPVKLHEPDVEEARDLTTDAQGEVRFEAAKPGLYGLRAAVVEDRSGEHMGKPFPMIRNYSTLTFTVPGVVANPANAAPVTVPPRLVIQQPFLIRQAGKVTYISQADPAAYELLKAASGTRQVMPDSFPGFTSKLAFSSGGKSYAGTVRFERGAAIVVDVPGVSAEDKEWLEDQVPSIIGHRRGGDFAQGDGRNPLHFGKVETENSFGKLIELGDRMNSSYRVRDNKITEVTREAGGTRFTISVVDTMDADPGKYLSTHFIVSYRDKATGALKQVEAFNDEYAKVGAVWLPASRNVTTFDEATTPHTRRFQFKDIQVLAAK